MGSCTGAWDDDECCTCNVPQRYGLVHLERLNLRQLPHSYKSNLHSHLFGTISEVSKKYRKTYRWTGQVFVPTGRFPCLMLLGACLCHCPQPYVPNAIKLTFLPLRTRTCGKARVGVDLIHPHPFESGKSGLLNEETVIDWVDKVLGCPET